jgi:hypothetical protein
MAGILNMSVEEQRCFVEFRTAEGDGVGGQIALPLSLTTQNLETIINDLLNNVCYGYLILILTVRTKSI